jgi:succinate dehydrogenase / fumarate reductase cytochrome b subunit
VSTLAPPPPSATSQPSTAGISAAHQREVLKTEAPAYNSAPGRRHFWIRRLHSFMGLLFGGYVATHLIVNATGLWPRVYQGNVDHIHSLEPMLPAIEILTIFLPLLIHAIYGIYITKAGVKFNTTKYNYGGNVRYTLQRWAGVVLLLFIGFHIATLHKWGFALIYSMTHWSMLSGYDGGGLFNPHNQAFQSTVSGIQRFWNYENPWTFGNMCVMAFYLLGVWSATFHFANGLWTSAIAWGLTTTRKAQQRWGHVCFGFGILLTIIGTIAWAAFTIAPNAQGDLGRWDDQTHTMPDQVPVDVPNPGAGVQSSNASQ